MRFKWARVAGSATDGSKRDPLQYSTVPHIMRAEDLLYNLLDPWVIALLTTVSLAFYRFASPLVSSVVASLFVGTVGIMYLRSSNIIHVAGDQSSGWLGDGDSLLLTDVLPDNLARMVPEGLVERIKNELSPLSTTGPQGGIRNPPATVVVESKDENRGFPLYRYPAQPLRTLYEQRKTFAEVKATASIRNAAARLALQTIEAGVSDVPNSCVANYYCDGSIALGPHKDKTLDLEPGSSILLVSLGAPRVLVLRRAEEDAEQRITLRHGSLFILGPRTNKKWTHAIPAVADASGGARLSLTLRNVSTHARSLDPSNGNPLRLTGRGKDFPTIEFPEDKAARAL